MCSICSSVDSNSQCDLLACSDQLTVHKMYLFNNSGYTIVRDQVT